MRYTKGINFSITKRWIKFLKQNPKNFKWFIPWWVHQNKSSVACALPWMVFEAIDYLKKKMKKDFKVFEWGSGGSTLFFASYTDRVVSIEYSFEWFTILKKEIEKRRIENIDYRLVPGEKFPTTGATNDAYVDNKHPHNFLYWEDYVRVIEQFDDNYFDVIVVDGRARPGCITHSVSKLKRSGMLVVDNSERAAYQKKMAMLNGWAVSHFYGPVIFDKQFSRTSIYQKP